MSRPLGDPSHRDDHFRLTKALGQTSVADAKACGAIGTACKGHVEVLIIQDEANVIE